MDDEENLLASYTHSTLRTDDPLATTLTAAGVASGLGTTVGDFYYLKDALGSVTDIVNASGEVIQHHVYSSFGKLVRVEDQNEQDITSNPLLAPYFTYTSRELDSESGFYYYRARYYSPEIGRFLQVDPHPGETDNPITFVNKYVYTLNNPVNLVDPNGLFGIFQAITLGAFLGVTDPFGIVSKTANFIKQNRNKIIGASLVIAGAIVAGGSGGLALPLGAAIAGAGVGIYKTDNDASLKELGRNAFIGAAIGVAIVVVPGGPLAKAAAGGGAGILASSLTGGNTEENLDVGIQGAITGGIAGTIGGSSGEGSVEGNSTGGNKTVSWSGGRLISR